MYGAMFGTGAIFLLALLALAPRRDVVFTVLLGAVTAFCFAGFLASMNMLFRSAREPPLQVGGPFVCRHCGTGFAQEGLARKHEQSCVEMKL